MEDKVAKIYKEFTFSKWKTLLVMISFIIILSLGVSIFLGSPFLHKETIDFIYVWQPGWLIEKEYLIYVIILGGVNMERYTLQEELKYHHDKINELINVVNELLKRNQKLEDEIVETKNCLETLLNGGK